MQKLNQVIAIEKSTKSRVCSEISKLHKMNQKADLFNGFDRVYRSNSEDGEQFPSETKIVQLKANEMLDEFANTLTELLNITATKDWANTSATANVVVDGQVLIENAPTPYLLFLEKQILDIKTYFENIPELDPSETWIRDENVELYKSREVSKHRTKKVARPIVLYEATKEHQAQTQLINDDVIIGYWNETKQSGAISTARKKVLLNRIQKIINAVKYAREEANSVEAQNVEVGKHLFDYLLKK